MGMNFFRSQVKADNAKSSFPEKMRADSKDIFELTEVMNEYLGLLKNTKRLFLLNLAVGMVRGFGMAIGATIVFGIMVNIAVRVIDLDLPYLSSWVAQFMVMVEENRHNVQ